MILGRGIILVVVAVLLWVLAYAMAERSTGLRHEVQFRQRSTSCLRRHGLGRVVDNEVC